MKQRELEIPEASFERRNRQTSWLVSFIFHAALLLPLFLITCSPSTEPEDLTLIEWGGGGDPNINAPVGPTPKGEPDGGEKKTTEQKTTTEPKSTEVIKSTRSPDKIPEPRKEQSSQQNDQEATKTETTSKSTENSENQTDAPKGNPKGEGTQPASGSGKASASGFGLGAGRSWIVHPRSTIPAGLTGEYGTVVVSYVVKPDGRVTSISKVSGPTALFNKIKGYLSRARVTAAEPGSPDIRGQGTVTFQ